MNQKNSSPKPIFNSGDLIRHISCLDLDLFILSRQEDIYKVRYYNRHYKIFQGKIDEVEIKDVSKWSKVL